MSKIIEIKNLSKVFKLEVKRAGFMNKLRSLFHPEYTKFVAVDGINLEVQE